MDQDSKRPRRADENRKQVHIRGSSSTWLLTPVEKENGWLERHLKRLCCSHRSCQTVTNTVTDTLEHTFTRGMQALSTRGALILNFVKDFQQDTAMKGDCSQNGLFQELSTNGSWTVEEGLSPRLYEGRTDELRLFIAKLTVWNPWILLDVRIHLIRLILFFSAIACHLFDPLSVTCTLSSTVSQLPTLPRVQGTTALTDFFSRGYDPFTHACKARPLTDLG